MGSREIKDFWLFMFDYKSELVKERRNNVITIEKKSIWFLKDFFYEIKRLSSTKDYKMEEFWNRFFDLFWRYKKQGQYIKQIK